MGAQSPRLLFISWSPHLISGSSRSGIDSLFYTKTNNILSSHITIFIADIKYMSCNRSGFMRISLFDDLSLRWYFDSFPSPPTINFNDSSIFFPVAIEFFFSGSYCWCSYCICCHDPNPSLWLGLIPNHKSILSGHSTEVNSIREPFDKFCLGDFEISPWPRYYQWCR